MADDTSMLVQFQTVDQAANDLQRAYQIAQTALENLDTNLRNTIGPVWHGAAADLYVADQQKWAGMFETMHAALQNAGVHANDTYDLYVSTENKNVGMWGGG